MSLKYGIIGTGAIGGYYGAKLNKAGHEVHFLFHKDYEFVKSNGLQIDSVDGSFHLSNVAAYRHTKDMPQCDVVLVCLKSINNGMLKEMLPPLLHPDTLVILIENGIGLEADLQEQFPTLRIAAGLAFICSGKFEPGVITHQSLGRLIIAPYSCQDTALLTQVVDDFNTSDIEATCSNYATARWKKAVWNIPFNGLTVVLNTTTDMLLGNKATESLIKSMMIEVIRAANSTGLEEPLRESFADTMIDVTKSMPPYSPSMKLDFDYQRPMEVYYLYSRPVIEAEKHGFDMALTRMLERQLTFIDSLQSK